MPDLSIESLSSMQTRRYVAASDLLLFRTVEQNPRGPRPPRPKASDPPEPESLSRGAPPRATGKCPRASGFPDPTTVNTAPPNGADAPPGSHCRKVPVVLPLCLARRSGPLVAQGRHDPCLQAGRDGCHGPCRKLSLLGFNMVMQRFSAGYIDGTHLVHGFVILSDFLNFGVEQAL
jgi:hypothetical protein